EVVCSLLLSFGYSFVRSFQIVYRTVEDDERHERAAAHARHARHAPHALTLPTLTTTSTPLAPSPLHQLGNSRLSPPSPSPQDPPSLRRSHHTSARVR